MSDEFIDAQKIKESLNGLDSFLDSCAKIISQAKTVYEPNTSRIVESVARMSIEFNDLYKDMKFSNEAVKFIIAYRKWLDELRVSLTALSEIQTFKDAIKCEETLDQLIDVAPLEEEKKIELKREAEERLRFENYWKQKEHNCAVAAIIASIVVPILVAIISTIGNSGTTINIDSPTIVIEDAESAENLIAQMEELLDKLQEE